MDSDLPSGSSLSYMGEERSRSVGNPGLLSKPLHLPGHRKCDQWVPGNRCWRPFVLPRCVETSENEMLRPPLVFLSLSLSQVQGPC